MKQTNTTTKHISVSLDIDLVEKLKELQKEKGFSISKIINLILKNKKKPSDYNLEFDR